MSRQAVSLEELFGIIDEEYRRARSDKCRTCVTPLPVRRSAADDVSTNWFVTEAEDCPQHCRVALAEIVTRLMSEYELERTVYGARAKSPRRAATE